MDNIRKLFEKSEAILQGHFKLSSGNHSEYYIQCAKLQQYPDYNKRVAKEIYKNFKNKKIDLVLGPAMGGIVLAYEVAKMFKKKFIFTERVEENGKRVLKLRRGFEIIKGDRILIVEDVLTTGGTVFELRELLDEIGAEIVGVGFIIDRSPGNIEFGFESCAALEFKFPVYKPEECPLCKDGKEIIKPGSR